MSIVIPLVLLIAVVVLGHHFLGKMMGEEPHPPDKFTDQQEHGQITVLPSRK